MRFHRQGKAFDQELDQLENRLETVHRRLDWLENVMDYALPGPHETVRWQWFIECEDCGKVHPWRWLNDKPKQGTWAAEEDSHLYRPRLQQGVIEHFYREYTGEPGKWVAR